jgi:DNA replication licensing factor MCM5
MARKCAPKLTDAAAQKLVSHLVQVRGQVRGMAKSENIRTAIPITVR